MKKNILTIFLCVITVFSFAQDVIYKKDNTKIDGKVLEVGTAEIKYKLASNPEGPTYNISKSEVAVIIYKNGSSEVFSSGNNSSGAKFDSLSVNFRRNFLGIDIAEFTSISVGIVYERIFGEKGMFAIRIPLSVGTQMASGYPNGKIFTTGLDLLYFPTGQGTFKYYAAPYFEYGMFNNRYNIYYGYYSYSASYTKEEHFAGGIKNGILFQPTQHFCFSGDFGLGLQKNSYRNYNPSPQAHFRVNVIIGYRF